MAKLIKLASTILIVFVFWFSLFSPVESHALSGFFPGEPPVKNTQSSHYHTTHIHFFFHDHFSGIHSNSTTNTTDALLTQGPEQSSSKVGTAEGIYFSTAKLETRLLVGYIFAFTEQNHNGSTICVIGKNKALSVASASNEMPVVEGTGEFQSAHGYAEVHTHWFNATSGEATYEYNVSIM